ncbi:unnamed protein product [Euphydryas editha]|uniref:DUF7869 domain-containing protein n=1 Tax=Euphydryas editha TaxID=104508 RepID=A0AAU9TP29_EUPED|nr:unnamed protein product [Euphydryas editha]
MLLIYLICCFLSLPNPEEIESKIPPCPRKDFNGTYNLGFGSPRTDACSRCIELNEKVKTADLNLKQEYIVQKRIHTLKAKAFYNLLQTNEEHVITLSFDCQKNMMLDTLPDQSAYFSRQINFYNFTVVVGTSKSKLEKENVFMYYWNEAERPKGSNEISSAVFHCLKNIIIPRTVDTIKLFADGCGGQNKNTTMIGMCSKFLFTYAPRSLKKIEIIFPIVGHSFLPPDRVFAKIEKTLRKKEIITDPKQYVDILQEHGTTFNLGQEVPVYDFKKECSGNLKPPVATINNVKKEKITDVTRLLSNHYGENWKNIESLKFYRNLSCRNDDANLQEEDLLCEPIQENDKYV